MKLIIVTLISFCAASAFAQLRTQAPPRLETSVQQAGTPIQYPVPVEVRHTSNANGVSQESVISSSPAHTVVLSANSKAPIPRQVSPGHEAGTTVAMPQAVLPKAGKMTLRANEKAPAPAGHFESSDSNAQQK